MRSPYSDHSLGLRAVNLYGHVGYDGGTAVSSGFGVRPALLSEKLCVRRTRRTRITRVMSGSMVISQAVGQWIPASAGAPLSF